MSLDYQKLCSSVCEIARTVGKFISDERDNFDSSKIESKGLHDLVSYVDKEAEKKIVEQLEKLLPEAGFITEEGTISKKGEQYNWVIDPLDGTTNFIQGVPLFAVSIALIENNEPVVGVVYEIGRDECFSAWRGGGSYLNGKQIHVSTRSEINDALLATGFPYSDFTRLDEYMQFLKWAVTHGRGLRRMGSAATDLAYVACGRFDAFWEYNLNPWDVAAGVLIVHEAGGKIFDFSGGDDYLFGKEIVASNGLLADLLQSKIKEFLK